MSPPPGSERGPVWQRPVTYAAIGATQDDAFVAYPPTGYRALERTVRLGHGEQRWHHAWTETLSLGIQRRAGLQVTRLDVPDEMLDNGYTPVTFDEAGQPVQPAATTSGEQVYADTGAQLVRPGDTVLLRLWPAPLSRGIPVRIVYLIDEPRRRGFAYGTLPGHPVSGEEAFVVEQRDDESVWLTVRSFWRPAHPALWPLYPVLRLGQAVFASRYEHALTRPLPVIRP